MKVSPHAAPPTAIPPKLDHPSELNPARQAKAAQPEAKGAEFGHLVASFAHARHAPPPASLTPPIIEPPGEDISSPEASGPPDDAAVVEDASVATDPAGLPPAPALLDGGVETQLLAELIANSQPGATLDITA